MTEAYSAWSTIQKQRRARAYLNAYIKTTGDTSVTVQLDGHCNCDLIASYGVRIKLGADDHGWDTGVTGVCSSGSNIAYDSRSVSYNRTHTNYTKAFYCQLSGETVNGYGGITGGTVQAKVELTIPAKSSWTVSYNANGGSGAPGAQTKWRSETLTLSSTVPTRTGYAFKGWATSASGSVAYAAGASYTANSGATLYAVWQELTYTIKYNANGGSGAPSNQTKYYTKTLTLSSTVPTRTDYTFLGWGTSASATKVTFAAGSAYTANSSITLYAVWSSNTYTPNAPSGFSASRVRDAQAKLSWTNNPADHKAYAGIYVDRLTDNGSWVNIANLSSSTTSYADTTTSAGHRYQYRIRSYNSAGSSSNVYSGYIYTTPKAFSSIAATKPTTLTVALTPAGMPTWYDAVEFQVSTNNGSSWSAASVSKTGTATWTDSNPPAGTVVYRGRSQKNGLYSSWVTSNSVLTVQAPNAPTVAALNKVYVVGKSVTVKWTRNHPDGTAQAKAQVEVTAPSGTATTYDISGATTSYAFTASTAGTYKVRVRTYGLATSWGAWSSYAVTQVAYVPVVNVTNPSQNDELVTSLPINLTWEIIDSTGVGYQQLTIEDSSGNTILQTELASDVRSYTLTGSLGLNNGASYTANVYVRGGSSLTATFIRTFNTRWLQPDTPLAALSYDENMAAHIVVGLDKNGTGYQAPLAYTYEETTLCGPIVASSEGLKLGGEVEFDDGLVLLNSVPATISYSIIRVSPDGEYTTLISELDIGTEFVDYIPPLNIDFAYIVTAYAESGAASQLVIDTVCNSKGYEVFNFGTGASVPLLVMFDAQGEEQNTHGGESFHFATGEDTEDLPTFYPDGSLDVSGSHSYKLHSVSDYRNARAIARKYPVGWFRSYWGWVKRVAVNISTDYSAQDYGLWNISADITEQTWEEPYVNE